MNAILSTSNKDGLETFASGLIHEGFRLFATGKTSQFLRDHHIPVTDIEALTGFPEMLGGRVKTLHPAIHAGILARDHAEEKQTIRDNGWLLFDLVVVNLYDFHSASQSASQNHENVEEVIEQIDIGGVTLLRSAAKNFERVGVVCDPEDYPSVLQRLQSHTFDLGYRRSLAAKVFGRIAAYDQEIAKYLGAESPVNPGQGFESYKLRYGENPHQKAWFYASQPSKLPFEGLILQGKELSFNNIVDIDSAIQVVASFGQPCAAIVKHASPCGIACGVLPLEAYNAALASDPVSAFGGIVAMNCKIGQEVAEQMTQMFCECVAAPDFSDEALRVFSRKKNLRVLKTPFANRIPFQVSFKSVLGGYLVQEMDFGDPEGESLWRVVSNRSPSPEEMDTVRFAWQSVRFMKSNAVVLCQGQATVGVGSGQPNRVDCVKLAAERAGEKAVNSVLASDAFFPFADSIDAAHRIGVRVIIEPGGSVRDQEVIDAANRYDIALIFTGCRHFRH